MKKDKLLTQLIAAYSRLQEALGIDLNNPLAIDGTIQRFEFCFELSWKTIKSFVEDSGIEVNSPKNALKEGYKMHFISDEKGWLDLLKARNLTVHIYDQEMANTIYNIIQKRHSLFADLISVFQKIG